MQETFHLISKVCSGTDSDFCTQVIFSKSSLIQKFEKKIFTGNFFLSGNTFFEITQFPLDIFFSYHRQKEKIISAAFSK